LKHIYRVHNTTSYLSLTHSWSWTLLEKSSIEQLLKNFPIFYGTWKFITVFTRALHWFLPWTRSIQSIASNPTSLWFILILPTHLRLDLPSGLFPSDFFPIRAKCPDNLTLLDFIILITQESIRQIVP
jgi:hypothetical protein